MSRGSFISTRLLIAGIVTAVLAVMLPVVSAQSTPPDTQLLSFNVTYGGRVYDSATNQTTFSYTATGVSQRPDLSHFDVQIPSCSPALLVVSTSPSDAVSFGVDPTTGVDGIKWDLPLRTDQSRTYSITFLGNVAEGPVQVAVKADSFEIGTYPGPSCQVASIDVDKFISVDGITWNDADDAPGPEYAAGASVFFRFVVTNIGNVELSNISIADNVYNLDGCALPGQLAPAAVAECTFGPVAVVDGQHTNVAVASGVFNGIIVTASDSAHYFSGNLPNVRLDKTISKDGGATWADGIRVRAGRDVSYKLVVTNTGNVPLTNIVLTDESHSTGTCTPPQTLAVDATYECIIGPFLAGDEDHINTAAVTAAYEAQTVSDTDTASYRTTDDDDGVVIIIEGPIEIIENNIITIFGFEIEIDPNDPILTTINIGDIIHIEGDMEDSGVTIVIVAVTVVIIDVDIVIVNNAPSGPIFVPHGCKITGIGNNNPHLKCSGRSGKSSKKS